MTKTLSHRAPGKSFVRWSILIANKTIIIVLCALLRYRMFMKPVDEEIPQRANLLRRWFPR
jgi:hypothetical protein